MSQVLSSDATEELVAKAKFALTATAIYSIRDLAVETDGIQLVLSGRVATFYHKQMAQEAVRTVADGIRVCNLVEVTDESDFD